MLGTRVIRSGDILSADQLQQLTFHPLRTEDDAAATVTYLPIYENRVAPAATMTISIKGKEDLAPIAEDCALETYKNLAIDGKLKVSDPEGSALTYTLTREPKRGEVSIHADGSFTYTPRKNKVGTDSFTYTATDAAGNVSREATVTMQVMKTTNKTQYSDTIGSDCRFAAEWMKNTGLFTGESIDGQICFQPGKNVTRGEFVAMLVRTLNIPVDESVTNTGFSDDVPSWLRPYLAAAQRAGLMASWQEGTIFGAEMPITGAQAAVLLQNALQLPTATVSAEDSYPEWAAAAMATMAQNGICLSENAMTRGRTAIALYRVSQLAATAPGTAVFFRD
jgi:VCBS repeat-containing protein